jgi:hypothetical protein
MAKQKAAPYRSSAISQSASTETSRDFGIRTEAIGGTALADKRPAMRLFLFVNRLLCCITSSDASLLTVCGTSVCSAGIKRAGPGPLEACCTGA